MATAQLDSAALRELTSAFRGELVQPGDAGYDEHRKVWNGSIDRHPALIARCAGTDDVIARAPLRARRPACRSPSAAAATASPATRSATAASSSTWAR